ncbi:MAG: M23 family metallopeptidase [Deltaproteobacteria bacterium]|nr:MAG: M23 family metallopeptidase [Deltaproteobacteria bacterium]
MAAVLGWAGVIGLSVALIAVLPKALSYDDLLDENLSMRGRVQELDRRMAEVDRILMRLRIYDAQMRGLGDIPEGDHGPTEDIDDPPPDAQVDPDPDPGDDGPYDQVEVGEIGQELRPSGAWADAIIARADSFLAVFEEAEPDLNALVEELEGLRALEEALPSHWPTTGTLTSGFGYRRSPFGRKAQFHKGLDISNARGTPVVASGPGTVRSAFYNGGYGRFIEVDHGYGITTRYAHLHRLLVKEGDEVERGQLIGTVGRTGRVTGPHLHFEVRIDGHAVDPLDYLPR